MTAQPSENLTPLMRQYWDVKAAHPDKVVLFRMGDFFEMFHDDAVTAAPILGIALTKRNKKSADETPMCGVPHHSIAGPINKLLQSGHKVAICEQVEDPKLAKGLVKRAVTRILSPGMVYDSDTLGSAQPNYILAFDLTHLACLDATTGESFYFSMSEPRELASLLQVLRPVEVLVPEESIQTKFISDEALAGFHRTRFTESVANSLLEAWIAQHPNLPTVARLLVEYAVFMQGPEILATIAPFEERHTQTHLQLSPTVIRHLEMFETYKGETKGSLFQALDRTRTSAGCRMLKTWLSFPLREQKRMEARLDQIETWLKDPTRLQLMRSELSQLGDVERRLGKISNPGCHGRDLLALCESLQVGARVSELGGLSQNATAQRGRKAYELASLMARTLVDEPPFSTRQGQMIRQGVSQELDELIDLSEHSQKALLDLELREKQATGISSLKVRYNQVFGYYIEITNTHKEKVPSHYARKQTLANAERFITDELIELERRILTAKTRRSDLEFEIFESLRKDVLALSPLLLELAREWAQLDVVTSLAWLALEQKYVRPQFRSDTSLRILAGRHPVVEQAVSTPFVPNSLTLHPGGCLLLTGPNMAGKSTLMRQVAVLVILAQMGSFVPAEQAELGIFERIFTRIGASDFISEGLSTFMVEMQETAEMLKDATARSLVLLDEVGRGTSTYDGMSLAQAILEYLLENKKASVLFATHYHELTQLATRYPQIQNAHMSIREKDGQIYFLHTLVKGPATRSYGIHVARLAGLPGAVTQRAQIVLRKLEKQQVVTDQMSLPLDFVEEVNTEPLEPSAPALSPHLEEHLKSLKELNISTLTPLEALNHIAKWQQSLS